MSIELSGCTKGSRKQLLGPDRDGRRVSAGRATAPRPGDRSVVLTARRVLLGQTGPLQWTLELPLAPTPGMVPARTRNSGGIGAKRVSDAHSRGSVHAGCPRGRPASSATWQGTSC